MGKYIKKFDTHSDYEDFTQTEDFIKPNVSYCVDNVEVHYSPYVDPYNGHEYVDLGLPSGTLWATMNVGATKPEEYGLYFQWGDTEGYADASTKAFTWDDYKWTEDGGSTMSKYNATDGKTALDLEDDAARANLGEDWHMPTEAQFRELLNTDYCTNALTTINGVNGRLFISVTNGNTLFIPAAGGANNSNMFDVGNDGYVWSNSSLSSGSNRGRILGFGSSSIDVDYGSYRCRGYSVRPVIG